MSQLHGSLKGSAPFVLALCLISILTASVWFLGHDAAVPERKVTGRPVQIETADYISSRACRSCHPNEYATWHESYHRTMTQVATPQTIVPSFDNERIE